MKHTQFALRILGCAGALALGHGALAQTEATAPSSRTSQATVSTIRSADRIGNGPVIYPGMPGLEGELGGNIDGPAVIKVPAWVKNPLGKYYMYFAHHRGEYIRLAYADRPEGPWTVYQPGTLHLKQTSALHHIASPDVMLDEKNRQIVLYYHGAVEMPGGDYGGRPYFQSTFVATSPDGLSFEAKSGAIAAPYMRAFEYKGNVYGLAMADKASAYPLWLRSGQFLRSADGIAPFSAGSRIIDEMRHAGLTRRGDTLHVFYSVVGDLPERILYTAVDLRPDWLEWTATQPVEVLRPERDYEGTDVPLTASKGGMASQREHALRDPAILDEGGELYLYYTAAGEQGIAVARVSLSENATTPSNEQ